MAIQSDVLASYIVNEVVSEFNLEGSNESLEKYADALSRAVSKFLQEDVEVAIGQQINGQGVGEIDDGGGGTTTLNTEVTGQVTTKGNLL